MKEDGDTLTVIGYDSKLPEFLPLWAHVNGADILSADGRTAQLDDPKVVEALEWANSIYDQQGGFPKVKAVRDSANFFGDTNQFATDALGAFPMEQWYVDTLSDVSPDAPMAFTTVKTHDGEPTAYLTGSAWAIPKGSKNAGEACRFAKEMTSVEGWVAMAEARAEARAADGKAFTGLLTSNKLADEKIQPMVDGQPEPYATGGKVSFESYANAFALPANPDDYNFRTTWQDAVNKVLNGEATAEEALDAAQATAQESLDAAWAKWDEKK
jgi:multiple sugar transport system substrate-binding protein